MKLNDYKIQIVNLGLLQFFLYNWGRAVGYGVNNLCRSIPGKQNSLLSVGLIRAISRFSIRFLRFVNIDVSTRFEMRT